MKRHRRQVMIAAAAALTMSIAMPTVGSAGTFGLHIGSGGLGVSVGFGDWGIYTSSWSDPYWSFNFDATLAGYGEWTWVSGLGRVWRPWVSISWRPYTYGRWVFTSYGWTWVAYEPWGYVPHHYGSWAYTSFGWVWVPGYSYSCANVVWVRAGGYVGWYARPPWGWSHSRHAFRDGYHQGHRDGYGNGYFDGYHDGWRDARYATYVDWRHFGSENVSRYSVAHRIASSSRIEGLANGPSRDEIRRRGGGSVNATALSRRTVTMNGREITIARPEGVARSIERNAAETVGSALSRQAIERRQPLVTPRAASRIGEEAPSRSANSAREIGSRNVQPSTRQSSPRIRQPAARSQSSSARQSPAARPANRAPARITDTSSTAERRGIDLSQSKSRRTDETGRVGGTAPRSAPVAARRRQIPSDRREAAQPSTQRQIVSRQSPVQSHAPAANRPKSSSTQRRVPASRSSAVPGNRSASARGDHTSLKKRTNEPSRKRRD
jgi:hypothetical protein